ncbi:hypothetical protein AI2614V1_4046 [Klebsiella oxytoca]|nr:hypothetical protein AI2614V1_4046 [Klebsiella oxytoca]CAH3786096.1 hypothetical protein AI2614V1_4046 [Klebsiella oxytoca]
MVNSYTNMPWSIKKLSKGFAARLITSFRLAYSWDMWRQSLMHTGLKALRFFVSLMGGYRHMPMSFINT